MKIFLKYLIKVLMVAFGLLSIALLLIALFRPGWMKMAIEWIGTLVQSLGNWNYLVAFSSALIESFPIIGVLVPGMNIMILVGGFWGKYHLVFTIIAASLGAMIGNYTGYLLGQKYGKHIIAEYGEYIGLGKTEQKILENQIAKNGFWYIVLGKFHGTLRAFIPFIAGASDMTKKNFWIYNAIGSIVWAIVINLIWVFFIEKYEVILDNIDKIMTVIFIAVIAYLFFFKKQEMKKYWDDKNTEMNEKYQKKEKKITEKYEK